MFKTAQIFVVNFCSQCFQLLSNPHCRFLTLLTLLVCSITPFLSINLPFSSLYKVYHERSDTLELAEEYNSIRLSKARSYFNGTDSKKSLEYYKRNFEKTPDVITCIVTVKRSNQYHETGYLIQTSSVMDSIIKSDVYFKNSSLFVCNVERDPASHGDASFLQQYIPFVQKYGANSFGKTFPVSDFVSNNQEYNRRKELEDYVFCLNVSKSFGAKYVLMLEDDVVPYKHVFEVVHYVMKQHDLNHLDHLGKDFDEGRQFAFLKLYYPERWQGFAFEIDRLLELLSISVIGGAVLLLFASLCAFKSGLAYSLQMFYFVFGSLMTMLTSLLVGRHNIMALRRISPQLFVFRPTPGCCTPAMFYSTHILSKLIEHLISHSEMNKDLAISHFITTQNIPGYFLEPNLFRHIGMYTSLQYAYKPPQEFIFDMP